jgi:hypothetical protein
MNNDATFEIGGLTRIDALRLRNRDGVTLREVALPQGTYGEPITFTMVVTAAALSIIAGYLLRKHQGEAFHEEITIKHRDGRQERRSVHWTKSATEAPESSVIKALMGSLHIGG